MMISPSWKDSSSSLSAAQSYKALHLRKPPPFGAYDWRLGIDRGEERDPVDTGLEAVLFGGESDAYTNHKSQL